VGREGDLRAKIQARRAYGNSRAIGRLEVDHRFQRPEIKIVFNAEGSPGKRVYVAKEPRRYIRTKLTSAKICNRKNISSEARMNVKLQRTQSKSVGTPVKQECDTTVGCTVATEPRRYILKELTSVQICNRKNIRSEARKNVKLERTQSKSVGTPVTQECDTTVATEPRRYIPTKLTSVQICNRKNMKLERTQSKSVGTPVKQECDTTVGCTVAVGFDKTGDNDLQANILKSIEICFSKLQLN
jgi:BRCT domain type II-containing protein